MSFQTRTPEALVEKEEGDNLALEQRGPRVFLKLSGRMEPALQAFEKRGFR